MDDKKCSFNEALRELFLNKTYSSKLREVYKRIECTDKNGDSFEYFKNEGGTASASLVSLMGIREDPENAFDNGAKHSPFEQILVDLYLNGAQGFYSDNLAIHGKIGDDDIAGEMDLLVVNSEGSFEVWDYKTVKDAKNKSFNFYKPYNQNDPLIQQYSFQLSSYAQMLEDKYSIDVTSIKIFAIAKEEITGHDIKFSKENNCTIEIPRISKERLDNRARANKANMKVAQTAEEKKEVVAENTENRHKQISKAEAYAMRFPYKLLSNTVIGTNEFFSTQNLFDILTTIDPSISDKINTSVAEGGDMYKIFAAHPELIEFLLEEAKNQIKKQINDINENISSLYEDGDKHKLDIDVDSLLDVNNDDNKQYINDHGILAFVFAANVSVGELINLKCKELNTTLDNLKKHIKPAPKSTEEKADEVELNDKYNQVEPKPNKVFTSLLSAIKSENPTADVLNTLKESLNLLLNHNDDRDGYLREYTAHFFNQISLDEVVALFDYSLEKLKKNEHTFSQEVIDENKKILRFVDYIDGLSSDDLAKLNLALKFGIQKISDDDIKTLLDEIEKKQSEKIEQVESTEKTEKTEKTSEAKPESGNNSNEIEKKVGDAKEVIDFGFNYSHNGQGSIFENKENQQFGSDLRSAHDTVDNLLGITSVKNRDGRIIYTIEQTEDPNKYVLNMNLYLPMGRGNDYSALSIVLDRNYVINKDDLNLLISKVVDDLHDNIQLNDVVKQLNDIKIRYTKISNPSSEKQHVAPSFFGKTSVYFYNNTVADAVYNLINSKDKNTLISLVADDSNGIVEKRKKQLDIENKDYDDLIEKSRNKISDIAKKSGIDNLEELYVQLTNIFSYIDIIKAINGDKSYKNEFKKKYDKIKDSDICDGLVKWLLKSKNQKLAVDYINSSNKLDSDTKHQIYLSFEYDNLMNYIDSKRSNEQQSSNESSKENTQNSEQNNNENSGFEDSFEDDNEDNDDGALLRKEIQGDYVIWDEKKEMEWLKSRLPNLSDKTMVVLRETLINVIKDGNSAWGAFVNGVIYVRSDAAAGTLYHEAFHALYHNILNKEEQLDIMRLARIKFGANLSTIGLEEAVANDFMEYKLKADEAIENRRKFSDKSVFGRFFNKILTIVYAIGDMLTENRSELDEYYRHIDMGFYSKRPIVFTSLSQMKQMERDANRKDGMSYFDTLDRHVQNALNAKGFTREQFDSLSDEEQDDEMMCCK